MGNNRYVLDANIFLEYIYGRSLQAIARQIIQDGILEKIQIIIPSLVLDEITEVLCGNMQQIADVQRHLQYIEKITEAGVVNIIVPNTKIRMKAVELARNGNRKSGYPELSDCLYHALAMINNAIFVTNDKKHIAKVKHVGHIMELSAYKTIS